jgi:hypothetical protein
MIDTRVLDTEFLRPMVQGWMGKLEAAESARSDWRQVSDECLMFYSHAAKAMWDPKYSQRFWKNFRAPRFKITINKAFEFVAIYGPNLFWDTPHREVTPKRPFEVPPELFPDEQMYEQIMQMHQQGLAADKAFASLMSLWLNYTPHEQPGGGLAEHGQLATIDALLEGRGCLWTELYTMPGSTRLLTGSFRDDPRNLLIDPDFTTLQKAKWVARRRVMPTWEAERRYGLPKGKLDSRATLESYWQYGEQSGNPNSVMHRVAGTSNDLIVVWEIWSKMGPGVRKTHVPEAIKDHLESVVGDYCFIAISPSVPYPLNMPSDELRDKATDADVREAFAWPIPLWQDAEWPVQVLDLYPDTKKNWPIPPLAAGLGELKFLNVMVPWLANRVWSSSRDFWAVAQGAMNDLEKYLKEGDDQTVVPVRGGDDIRKIIQVMQQPETRMDAWRIVDLVSELFDKRVGLTDFMYGKADTQDRSAETTRSRMSMIGIRPDYMRMRVKKWQSRVAATEAFLARLYIKGAELQDLLGPVGAGLWDQVVASQDVEKVMRQFNYTVAASSIQRPDKDKLADNANQMMQMLGPIADGHATLTGDTGPLNILVKKLSQAMDFDVQDIQFGPRTPPPPSEEEQQAMQQQQELEMAKLQTDVEKTQADLQGKQMDLMGKQMDQEGKQAQLEQKVQLSTLEMILKALDHEQSMEQSDDTHVQDLSHTQQSHEQQMVNEQMMFRQRLENERRKLQMQAQKRKKVEAK